MKEREKERGITLVAIVVTIIILLILAGVSISIAINGGIINRAKTAVTNYSQSADKEGNLLNKLFDYQEAYIEVVKGNINSHITPSAWTNGKVKVSLTSVNEKYKVQYQIDTTNGTWEDYKEETQVEVDKNCTIIARLINIVDTTSQDYTNINVSNIDTSKPEIKSATATTNTITIIGTDGASGIVGYAITTENKTPATFEDCSKGKDEHNNPIGIPTLDKTITGIKTNTYYVWLKDAAGNISNSTQVTTGTVSVATGNIKFTNNPTVATGGSVTVTISKENVDEIKNYTIQYQKVKTASDFKEADENWTEYKEAITTDENCIIYARLWDGTNGGSYITDTINNIYKNLTLSVNANGGTYTGSTSLTQNYNTTYIVPSPTRTGYTFAGWSLSGGGSLSGSTYTFGTSNGTLTANWKINNCTINLTYYGTVTPAKGSTITLPTPTRSGYSFAGWYASNKSTSLGNAGSKYTCTGDTTLYSRWSYTASYTTQNLNTDTWCYFHGTAIGATQNGESYVYYPYASSSTSKIDIDVYISAHSITDTSIECNLQNGTSSWPEYYWNNHNTTQTHNSRGLGAKTYQGSGSMCAGSGETEVNGNWEPLFAGVNKSTNTTTDVRWMCASINTSRLYFTPMSWTNIAVNYLFHLREYHASTSYYTAYTW